jgi:hypothetical protein
MKRALVFLTLTKAPVSGGMPDMFMPIMDPPISSSSSGLSTAGSMTSAPISIVPALQFCASSQRDRYRSEKGKKRGKKEEED